PSPVDVKNQAGNTFTGGSCNSALTTTNANDLVLNFRPDWAPKGECRGQHRPILWIPLAQPLSSFRFELAVHLTSDQFHQLTQGAQKCERLFRSNKKSFCRGCPIFRVKTPYWE